MVGTGLEMLWKNGHHAIGRGLIYNLSESLHEVEPVLGVESYHTHTATRSQEEILLLPPGRGAKLNMSCIHEAVASHSYVLVGREAYPSLAQHATSGNSFLACHVPCLISPTRSVFS